MNNLLCLRRYLVRHIRLILGGTVAIFIGNWFSLLIPKYTGLAVDYIRSDSVTGRGILKFALQIIMFAFLQAFFTFFMRQLMQGAARRIEFEFRNDLFLKFQSLHSGYYDVQKVGDLMAHATNDVEAVRMFLGPGIMFSVFILFLFPMAFYRMFSVNFQLSCYSIIPLLIMPFYVNRVGNRIHKRFMAVQDQFSLITSIAQENLAGIRVVKAFVREDTQKNVFGQANKEYIRRNLSLARIAAGFFPGMHLLAGMGILILLWLGGRLAIQGRLTLGELTTLTMLHMKLFWPMFTFGWLISLYQRGAASMKRIYDIIKVTPDVRDTDMTDFSISAIRGDIRINNLTFSYAGGEEPVLKDISVHVPAGGTLGIVGPVGCGKSTLIRLLVRLYNPPPEMVLIDGVDVRRIPLQTLRKHIGFVFQEPFLFSDTIHNNIAFSVVSATREEVIEVSKKVRLHEEILSFPQGYETMLGERGINLSGGQKQRLALARALVRNPHILILDDTLSAVDTETESAILSVLQREMQVRTSLVISHRISSVMRADEIIFLENGRIVERGTHEGLVALGGHYASIYEKQRLEEEISGFGNNENGRSEKEILLGINGRNKHTTHD
jgi:ATP-binding cassette subfamily B protein